MTNNIGFTLVEMMMGVAFTVLLMAGVFGFYNSSSQTYSAGIAGQDLQNAANMVLNKIISGATEPTGVYRLSTAVAYMIPDGSANHLYTCGGSAQVTPCNASNPSSQIYFCQSSPCTATDPTARWYYLNSTGTAVMYHHPTTGGTIDEIVYSAPEGSTMKLRFSPAAVTTPANVVEIDVALTRNLSSNVTNSRMSVSGSASTFVLLRNHS